ncbi:MAG: lytic transglycosylase domain-containing protein [Clostridia bacterium]|nr:lytic transglycosylase domain-containing protein [Clostridia bacterium]
MRWNVQRVVALLLLLACSVGFGFAFDAVATFVEQRQHPRPTEWSVLIEENAARYGIPEMVLWAIVNEGSGFSSNATSKSGKIGLMQLSPAEFEQIALELFAIDSPDPRLLYDPATNLQYGTAWLSHLYETYGIWELAYAAYFAGADTVDGWLFDPSLLDEQGILKQIPDPETEAYVNRIQNAVELYRKLYYTP